MKPPDWIPVQSSAAGHRTNDALEYELVPSTAIVFKGAPFHVNRWGMHDREYSREKPPGTYRIALLGASYVMGVGVANSDTFEALVEDRLNRRHDRRYELLNFAVGGYSPLQDMITLERKVFDFNPDAVFYFAHRGDPDSAVKHLWRISHQNVRVDYSFLVDLLHDAGIDAGTTRAIAMRRLEPLKMRLLESIYQRIADQCRAHGVRPVWVFLPTGSERASDAQAAAVRAAGFAMVDLSGVFKGVDRSSLRITPWDGHPNIMGHQLIAQHLYAALEQRPDLLGAPASTPPPASDHHEQ